MNRLGFQCVRVCHSFLLSVFCALAVSVSMLSLFSRFVWGYVELE